MKAIARSEPAIGLTVDEWAALPEDEPGELVDGIVVEEEAPDLTHETIVSWLLRVLGAWIVSRRGFVFGSEAKFAVAPRRGRKPDVSVFLPGRRKLPRRGVVRVPPDIAIEVVSPTPRDGRRDRVEKPDDYARFGVRWYWLVDPQERTLEILELGRSRRHMRVLAASEGRVRQIPGCQGLDLDLDALWAEIDRLVDDSEPLPVIQPPRARRRR